ncbi:MAG: LacI family DNA-binding transcriptional regulator [Planctomycetota bacterium]
MASVRDIAKQAGVSTATVSRVLNNQPSVSEAVKRRVLTAVNETGYVQSIGRRSTGNIAYVYTDDSSLGSPFDAAVMTGLSSGLESSGYDLMVLHARHSRHPEETFGQMFLRKGVAGAIIRTTVSTRHVCESIAQEGFPAVVVGDRFEEGSAHHVEFESREASREAVSHLLDQGHRRIAMCTNVVDDTDHVDRVAGYMDAMRERGLEPDHQHVIRVPANRLGGEQLVRRVLTMKDRPTALFVADPFTCIGVFKEARAQGIDIPNDLSVIGFDDSDLRYSVYPVMSSVCQDAGKLGREAYTLLQQLMGEDAPPNQATEPRNCRLRAWFEVHGSTAPYPLDSTE